MSSAVGTAHRWENRRANRAGGVRQDTHPGHHASDKNVKSLERIKQNLLPPEKI